MYQETLDHFGNPAQKKASMLSESPLAFAAGSLMAGAYAGIGIIIGGSVLMRLGYWYATNGRCPAEATAAERANPRARHRCSAGLRT